MVKMTANQSSYWVNCAQEADKEMLAIDRQGDQLAPLELEILQIRNLISRLELCHHKAEAWVQNILLAIGSGQTKKGLGTRPKGEFHPSELLWQDLQDSLRAWCAGSLAEEVKPQNHELNVSVLNQRSPLKEWQVQRVVERIGSFLRWPPNPPETLQGYNWMTKAELHPKKPLLQDCPSCFMAHQDDWFETASTFIHNPTDQRIKDFPLAWAIDLLMPCHWNFVGNLNIVMGAIGGELSPKENYFVCGLNMQEAPIRKPMQEVMEGLGAYLADPPSKEQSYQKLFTTLGPVTDEKKWLALSLRKTIQLQLDW